MHSKRSSESLRIRRNGLIPMKLPLFFECVCVCCLQTVSKQQTHTVINNGMKTGTNIRGNNKGKFFQLSD